MSDEIKPMPTRAIMAKIRSAVAAPNPDAIPIRGPCTSILRKHKIPIGPIGNDNPAPMIKPLSSKNSFMRPSYAD
jgi:hypothetical protein